MSDIFDDSNRQVVPRWLSYEAACSLGLLRAGHPGGQAPTLARNPRVDRDWQQTRSLATAIDVVAEALILRDFDSEQARSAAEHVLEEAPSSSLLIRRLAGHFLEEPTLCRPVIMGDGSEGNRRACIALLKKSVRNYHLDPIAWADLALSYAMMGHVAKSRRAMQVAVALGGQNRFILRSAARCFLHLDEADRSLALLRGSDRCRCDPWIASAEIAISEAVGLRSVCVRNGRHLALDENNAPFSRSELAACLGTIEAGSGSAKKARLFMREALRDPSENALAQAEWMSQRIGTSIHTQVSVPAPYEAEARHRLFRDMDFTGSLSAAEQWASFQPLSSRPLIIATYIASTCLDDNQKAIAIVRGAGSIHRTSPLLMNNFACALARQGDVDGAVKALESFAPHDLGGRESLLFTATRGLIKFRSGCPDEGRMLYQEAVCGFERLSDARCAATATYFWAVEEKRLGTDMAKARIADAKKRIRRSAVVELSKAAEAL